MPMTLAEAVVGIGLKIPDCSSIPAARVAIIEGRVKANGKSVTPKFFPNQLTKHFQRHLDITLPRGSHVVELFYYTGRLHGYEMQRGEITVEVV